MTKRPPTWLIVILGIQAIHSVFLLVAFGMLLNEPSLPVGPVEFAYSLVPMAAVAGASMLSFRLWAVDARELAVLCAFSPAILAILVFVALEL